MEAIFIAYETANKQNACDYFEKFNKRFKYLRSIKLIYTPVETYAEYQNDLKTIERGYSAFAEIIDTRDLPEHELQPVRLLLTTAFFGLPDEKKDEVLLHELGHYFTNPRLLRIRQFIAKVDPPLIGIQNATEQISRTVSAHNEGLNYIFQIPKLVQEVNAEIWVYENEPSYSEPRLSEYCSSVKESLSEFESASVQTEFLYEIPRINYLILWRKAILSHTNFKFTEGCLSIIERANTELLRLSTEAGWKGLRLLQCQDDVLNCLKYRNEKVDKIIEIYEEIFEDYIMASMQFFPSAAHSVFKRLYSIS